MVKIKYYLLSLCIFKGDIYTSWSTFLALWSISGRFLSLNFHKNFQNRLILSAQHHDGQNKIDILSGNTKALTIDFLLMK